MTDIMYRSIVSYDVKTKGYYGRFPAIEGVVIWAKSRSAAEKELEIVLRNIREFWAENNITPPPEVETSQNNSYPLIRKRVRKTSNRNKINRVHNHNIEYTPCFSR